MLMIDGLPVYFAMLSSEEGSLEAVSLVDSPAVITGWQAFSDEWKKLKVVPMVFADEERRLIRGVVMRAGFPILRDGYWLVFTAEAVRDIARRWLSDGRGIGFDLMHDGKSVGGVEAIQVFIKDTEAGVSPKGFEEVEENSLFCELHVSDEGVWRRIKAGELRGFSIAGKFDFLNIEQEKMDKQKFKERLWKALFEDEELPTVSAVDKEEPEVQPVAPVEGDGWKAVFEGGAWKRYNVDEEGNPVGDGVAVKAVFVPADFDEQTLFKGSTEGTEGTEGKEGTEGTEGKEGTEGEPIGGDKEQVQEPEALSASEVARRNRSSKPKMSELESFIKMAKKVKI